MGNVLSSKVWNIGFDVTGMLIQEKGASIAAIPPVFEMLSYLWTGMTISSVILLVWLIASVRKTLQGKLPKRTFLLMRAVLFGLLTLLLVTYLLLLNRDLTETPNFFGSMFGFYVDQAIGVVSFSAIIVIWTVYSLYLVMFRRNKAGKAPLMERVTKL